MFSVPAPLWGSVKDGRGNTAKS
ncbi:MAG: hypothetical protein K0Q86_1376, partial [Arthrobacter koreensis]|nr:hypothetical protein [Arthrobacter koreensis]